MSEPRFLREVGSDRLVAVGARIEIRSKREMPELAPRKYRRMAIVVDGERFYVADRRREGDEWVHVLERWPDDLRDLPGGEIVYDEAFVSTREATLGARTKLETASTALSVLSPFIGFLWAKTKRDLHERYGVHREVATRRSIQLEGWLWAVWAAGTVAAGSPHPMVIVATLWLLDVMFRTSSLLQDDDPIGVFEWPISVVRKWRAESAEPHVDLEDEERTAGDAIVRDVQDASAFVARIAADERRGTGRDVGVDRLFLDEQGYVVHARRAMPGWEPRKFRKLAVQIAGTRCHVVEALEHRGRAIYRLEPWPEGFEDLPLAEITYDAAYVEAREEEARALSNAHRRRGRVLPFSALLGFLWSGAKATLEDRHGLSPRRSTILSIVLEAAVAFLFVVLLSFSGASYSWPKWPPWVLATLAAVIGVDAVVRLFVIFRERNEYLGFLEWPVWLFRRDEP